MKFQEPKMDVVDFAYQVIDLYEENQRLKGENEHLRKLRDMLTESQTASMTHNERMIGGMLLASIGAKDAARKHLKGK